MNYEDVMTRTLDQIGEPLVLNPELRKLFMQLFLVCIGASNVAEQLKEVGVPDL